MRVTIAALGFELDLTLGPIEAETPANDGSGDSTSFPISFTSAHDMPDEAAIHRPTSPWEDDAGA